MREHMSGLLKRLAPESTQRESQTLEDASPAVVAKKIKFGDLLLKLTKTAGTVPHLDVNTTGSALDKMLQKEMRFLEGSRTRGPLLEKIYQILLAIKPVSVEAERAFSSSSSFVTKVRSRLLDDTLDSLCFLRSLFKNPLAYSFKEIQEIE
jgi:hAT family C-terminal dimerisation region